MTARFTEFKNKEIINLQNGMKVGYVDDVLFDTEEARIASLVVYGRYRFFGLFGRDEDLIIDWDKIEIIGEDAILVKQEGLFQTGKAPKTGFFDRFFG